MNPLSGADPLPNLAVAILVRISRAFFFLLAMRLCLQKKMLPSIISFPFIEGFPLGESGLLGLRENILQTSKPQLHFVSTVNIRTGNKVKIENDCDVKLCH